jgi:hypothetical protein
LVLGTKGATQSAIGGEFLEPLTVLYVRLAPWDLACVMGIDQPDVTATLFEYFEKGNPVDAGRLHHHGLKLTLSQPRGQGVEISRERSKALHRLLIAITGYGHPMAFCPHINPGRH